MYAIRIVSAQETYIWQNAIAITFGPVFAFALADRQYAAPSTLIFYDLH